MTLVVGKTKFKFHDKLSALEKLIRHLVILGVGTEPIKDVTPYEELEWVERARLIGQVLTKGEQQLLDRQILEKESKH